MTVPNSNIVNVTLYDGDVSYVTCEAGFQATHAYENITCVASNISGPFLRYNVNPCKRKKIHHCISMIILNRFTEKFHH